MNNQPKINQLKTGKGLKIIGITIILIAIGAMGWFLVSKQSQNNVELTQKNAEVKNKDKQEVVKNEQEQGQGKKVEEQNKNKEQEKVTESDLKNNQQNAEELKIEDIDTSNWKTYRNEEFGFEFKYPENIFNLQILDNGMELSISPFRGTLSLNLTKNNSNWKIAEKQSIYWVFRGIDGSGKQAVVENKYKNFQKRVKINNLEGIIFSYGPEDIGLTNEWDTIDFSPLGDVSKHKKEIITKRIYNDSQYKSLQDLLKYKCNSVSFQLILNKYNGKRGDIIDELVDSLIVNCLDGDASDAKYILTILQSFKFIPKE